MTAIADSTTRVESREAETDADFVCRVCQGTYELRIRRRRRRRIFSKDPKRVSRSSRRGVDFSSLPCLSRAMKLEARRRLRFTATTARRTTPVLRETLSRDDFPRLFLPFLAARLPVVSTDRKPLCNASSKSRPYRSTRGKENNNIKTARARARRVRTSVVAVVVVIVALARSSRVTEFPRLFASRRGVI